MPSVEQYPERKVPKQTRKTTRTSTKKAATRTSSLMDLLSKWEVAPTAKTVLLAIAYTTLGQTQPGPQPRKVC